MKNCLKLNLSFIFNGLPFWVADLAEIASLGSLSSLNCGGKYVLCDIDVVNNMLGINLSTVKTVLHGFIGIVKESKRKPNKLWVDEGR